MMHNKSQLGGVFAIISGALGVIGALTIVFFLLVFLTIEDPYYYETIYDTMEVDLLSVMGVLYGVMGAAFLLIGVLAIVGGILSIKRKRWGVALAGAIAGAISFFPLGIVAVIFISMGQPEFSKQTTGAAIDDPSGGY